jgi:tRNA pseudouridine55 synthase
MMHTSAYHGLLVVDKPGGLTSRDVVNRAQGWFPRGTRIGHTGTLDPLATGVLVLSVGVATRLTEYVQAMSKTYRARLLLGARSDSDDADGNITQVAVDRPPDRALLEQALKHFLGEIDQVPPAYSAAKVAGQRAYNLARAGQEVSLEPRRVRIDAIDILTFEYPHLELEVHCGKGTYIRSLARDLGEQLGCGALVETLHRTRVGHFVETDAVGLDIDSATARARLRPVGEAVAELPRLTLEAAAVIRLRQGQALPAPLHLPLDAPEVAVFDTAGNLVGVARVDEAKRMLRPDKVLPPV